jgi:hypothetical protein
MCSAAQDKPVREATAPDDPVWVAARQRLTIEGGSGSSLIESER